MHDLHVAVSLQFLGTGLGGEAGGVEEADGGEVADEAGGVRGAQRPRVLWRWSRFLHGAGGREAGGGTVRGGRGEGGGAGEEGGDDSELHGWFGGSRRRTTKEVNCGSVLGGNDSLQLTCFPPKRRLILLWVDNIGEVVNGVVT